MSIEKAFTEIHAQSVARDLAKQREDERRGFKIAGFIWLASSLVTFAAGAAVGHWCW